jgi:hypothetical protein
MTHNPLGYARPLETAKRGGAPHGYSLLGVLLVGFFLISTPGCGSAPPATQIVNVPVYTSCVKEVPLKPEYEFGKMSLTDSEGDKVLALARDWPRGRKYEDQLEAVIAGCL